MTSADSTILIYSWRKVLLILAMCSIGGNPHNGWGKEPVVVAPETALSGDVELLIGEEVASPPPGYPDVEGFGKAFESGQLEFIQYQKALPGVSIENDIVYAEYGDEKIKLDLYQPLERDGLAPGLVMIHGGGWMQGSKADYRRFASDFALRGYVVVSIDYRLVPDHLFPAAVQDCKAAVRWVRANAERLQIDSNRIAVMGGSAGSHLSMMVGYVQDDPLLEGEGNNADQSSAVQAVVNIYGPYDLTHREILNIAFVNKLLVDFLQGSLTEAPENYRLASPASHLDRYDPPTLILHGTIDNLVPISQADLLAQRLNELEIPYVYDRLEGWPHVMDFGKPVYDRSLWLTERFLKNAFEISSARNTEPTE